MKNTRMRIFIGGGFLMKKKTDFFYICEPISSRQIRQRYKGKSRQYNLTFTLEEFIKFCRDNDVKKQDALFVTNRFLDEISLSDIAICRAGRWK